MNKIVLISNAKKDKDLAISESIAKSLLEIGITVYSASDIENTVKYSDFPESAQAIVVVGGDGSVLYASVLAIEHSIPLVGVNLGKIGYLSEIDPVNISVLKRLIDDDFCIEEKMLLSVSHIKDGKETKSNRLAVNDIVVSHNTCLGISDFKLINTAGECVKYRADGLIFSTPQGSTAYSLSAGGPIISHNVDSILVTPVCPHSFFGRSVIFNKNEHLTIENSGESELTVSVDGRIFKELKSGEMCNVVTAAQTLKMITFSKDNNFSALFRKMKTLTDIV